MFGISAEKFIVIAVIAVLVIGPTRLPEYGAKLARLIREVRRMANSAQEQLKEQLGPEFEDVDWKKLDPRQYDPRRIIRDALIGDDNGPPADRQNPTPLSGPTPAPAPEGPQLRRGQAAPFDVDAT